MKVFVRLLPILLVLVSSNFATKKCLNDQFRPQYHFSPSANWMNDPNGMAYLDGEYHLFFQYNPDDTVWGPMHWGHAISTDLVTWTEQPIALYPDELGTIFSGSGVVDIFNTSGLQTGETDLYVAMFTHAGESQIQSLAYSNDRGRSMIKFEDNPVLDNPGIPDFRDPKVIPYGDKWVQALAVADRITFYESWDLITWSKLSEFGANPEEGAHGGVWECPDLLPMTINGETIWVLLVSINPGGPNGGSATQYFLGDFDGTTFRSYGWRPLQWADWGWDNYAGVTFSNQPDDRHIFIGWMNNWAYANNVPTVAWRGQMTVPRDLSLKISSGQVYLASNPIPELAALRIPEQFVSVEQIAIQPGFFYTLHDGSSFRNYLMEVHLNFTFYGGLTCALCFKNDFNQEVCLRYNHENTQFILDRSRSGNVNFHPDFFPLAYGNRTTTSADMQMQILIDHSSIEFFIDGGITAFTGIFFPTQPFHRITVENLGGGGLDLNSGSVQGLDSMFDC